MAAKCNASLVSLIVASVELAARIVDEINACENNGQGSMTISRKGVTDAKATILPYKIPLADEKRIRVMIQSVDPKLQLSRSNDLAKREDQYGFTHSVSDIRKAMTSGKNKLADKPNEVTDTPEPTPEPTPTT